MVNQKIIGYSVATIRIGIEKGHQPPKLDRNELIRQFIAEQPDAYREEVRKAKIYKASSSIATREMVGFGFMLKNNETC